MTDALGKYRICDFTGQLAGAGATRWLASFGADVIRIEDPVVEGRWDILRGNPPFKEGQSGLNKGGAFNNHNPNKRGITLNLRTDEAKDILTEIIRQSDVVAENFAAGVLKKWGFDYEQLKAIKPDIIYVSNCGFGHEGPYSSFKTWGPIVQAVTGLTFSSTLKDQEPAGWGYSYMDHTGGNYMAMAILLALMHREQTGEGQWVDLSCTDAGLSLNGPALLDWTVNGRPLRTEAGFSSNRSQYLAMAPHGIYPCAPSTTNDDVGQDKSEDHWIAIACRSNADWQLLADHINADWCDNFKDETVRFSQQDKLDAELAVWTASQDKFELQNQLRALPIPAAAVQKPGERIDDDHTTADFGLWPEVHHREMGKVRVDGNPVHFSRTDWRMKSGAPCLGEHNEEVLGELLGKSPEEVSELSSRGVL